MGKWMIPANLKKFNCASAFEKWGYIDWRQCAKYEIGDVVYIYCTKPYQRVMYKAKVLNKDMTASDIVDDQEFWIDKNEYIKSMAKAEKFVRLELVAQVDTDYLSLEHLKEHELHSAPQGPIKVKDGLGDYIDKYMMDNYSEGLYPDSDIPRGSYEGGIKIVLVNQYERSSIARKKCIAYKGCKCSICGIDFEKVYGEIGKGFIHVHHIVPLNQIGEEYEVDYKNDLIPVCPNCHAMLHRKLDGREITIDELKKEWIERNKK